jgi:Icc-related predicted phosphoesterase
MRLLVLADMDDFHWRHGSGHADVLISCGDMFDSAILEAAEAYGCALILAVKGNHDSPTAFHEPILDVHLKVREYGGLAFGGFNGSWRYKPRGHFLYDQSEAAALIAKLPAVDVLVSHNSPKGIHDRDDGVHLGFDGLNAYIARAEPRLVIHGHQHIDRETQVGNTRVIGIYGHRILDVDPKHHGSESRHRPGVGSSSL